MKLKDALNFFPNSSNSNNKSRKILILPKVKPKLLTKLYSEIMNNYRNNIQNESNCVSPSERPLKSRIKKYGKISIKEKKEESEYQNNSQRILSSIGNLNHGNSSQIFNLLDKPNYNKAFQDHFFKEQKSQIKIKYGHVDHLKLRIAHNINENNPFENKSNNTNFFFNSIDNFEKPSLKREESYNSILNHPLRTIQEKPLNLKSAAHFSGEFSKFQSNFERNKLGNVLGYYAYSLRGKQKNGKEKVNQDSYLYKHKIFGVFGLWAFGIFDGHGYNGEKISSFLKQKLCENIEKRYLNNYDHFDINKCWNTNIHLLKQYITEGFIETNSNFVKYGIDDSQSGSTANLILVYNNSIICSNVGDSRAIIFSEIGEEWIYNALSRDHNPYLNDEKERIILKNGRIAKKLDKKGKECGPLRIYENNKKSPGLAITRSMGDKEASDIGIICNPEILKFDLSKGKHLLIIGSDGFWNAIKENEIMNYILEDIKNHKIEKACSILVNTARIRWEKETNQIDDITLLLAMLSA